MVSLDLILQVAGNGSVCEQRYCQSAAEPTQLLQQR
jgi:hypothetical protein